LKAKSDFKTPEEIAELNSSFSKKTVKFSLDDLTDVRTSQPAAVSGGQATDLGTGSNDGIDIGSYINVNKSDLLWQQGSSAVNYALPTSAITSTDEVMVTVGPSTAQVKVPVTSSTAGSPPNAVDVAAALNNNSTFASSYVAQAYSSVTLKTVTFPEEDASVNDFETFEVTINGQTISLTNLSPAKATLDSLAAEIQHRLREEDGDRTDLVVKVSNDSLVLTDNASRKLTSVKLTPNAASDAAVDPEIPDAADYSAEQLKITALDPSVTAAEVADNIVIKQGTYSSASAVGDATRIASAQLETEFPRFSETYEVNNTGPYKVQLGTGTTAITLQQDAADSLTAFMQKLNSNERFAASFDASLDDDGNIKITAKDPTTSDTKAITDEISIMDATGEALVHAATVVPDGQAAPNGAPISFAGKKSIDDLKNLFTVNVDGSIESVAVSLDHLVESMSKLPATASKKLSGAQIAAELTNVMSRAYGDEKPFNFSTVGSPTFYVSMTKSDGSSYDKVPINLAAFGDMRNEDLVRAVQRQLDDEPDYSGKVTVSYDTQLQKLVFAPANNAKVTISSDQSAIGLSDDLIQGVNDESVGLALAPAQSTGAYRPSNDQRYGMKVEYDAVKQSFVFKSGTTGDGSAIGITKIRPGSLATQTSKGLGMTGDPANYIQSPSTVDALRGVTSLPAVLTGNALAVNVDNNFSVDATNNQFVVSVNGITGTVNIPPKDTYTLGTFMEALQSGINNLQAPTKNGLTPESVNGVKVTYDAKSNALVFTTGTASTDSYIKVTGDAKWGLDGLDAKFGTTTTWIKPKGFTDEKGATVYIDGFGAETSSAAGFETLPAWSPIYFDKGELTFDTAGNLVSPKQGAQLDTVYLPNGKGALTINIDYSKSTQFASPFAVLSQSQDGAPEGDLVGLAIKDDGLVSASFSNGAQLSLAKVVLVNFSNPTGLRQIGDTNYYKTSDSGTPKYGEAGSAGYGTLRSGATERANVDLTQELVDLITEQRNFQANAKAMETSTSMTQTIIQIRN
jgi:flagellar hook-basal body protein